MGPNRRRPRRDIVHELAMSTVLHVNQDTAWIVRTGQLSSRTLRALAAALIHAADEIDMAGDR